MQDVPECLSRRYKALDEFIKELNTYESCPNIDCSTDPSIRLLCNFWDILKEDPEVNLSQAVQQRMCVNTKRSCLFGPQHISCYMAGCCKKNDDKKQEATNKVKHVCSKPSSDSTDKPKCRVPKSTSSSAPGDELPLNKVLCNLKEVTAASFEKKCQTKVNELLETQTQLQEQIQVLEQREKDGVQLLKQADCMWSCMEETYKKKIAESLERQKDLLKQLKEVETSNTKWRKNQKDLEFQMDNINKCYQEITEKISQKTSNIKCIDMEIGDFKKRIDINKKDFELVKKSFSTKKQVSDTKIAKIAKEVARLENVLKEEQKNKKLKEQEGAKYVKEAREDLQKLCKVLLQKKLENEDMRTEGEALLLEVDLLKQNYDQCKDKCKSKQESINEEIKIIDKEIAEFKVKCIRCHECTDTVDVRKFCIDCPRCVDERDCLYEGDHCSPDNAMDCVCTTVKQKFLDNVFDNMYTVLERQIKSGPGKAVADVVLNCLKKSRNGKLNAETRKILQDFILTTVKKNLNLTIVGGAVKTRCEMDAETYKQLMLCLKQVKVTKPVKVDQGTESKKEPCRRWGGTSECNCPKGPKECICTKKAPQPPNEPTTCPPKTEDKEDAGEVVACPYKETTACGPDCAMHELPSSVGSEVASWRPNPCQGPTCQFKNMRAAQCVLGPEALSTSSNPKVLGDEVQPKFGHSSTDPYVCYKDLRYPPRDRIIEEVLGRYTEVAPIEKVSYTMISSDSIDVKNTKQVRVEKDSTCDKISYENKIGSIVDEKQNIVERSNQITTKDESNAHSVKNVLNDVNPIIFKSYSGDLKIALNQEIVEELNKNLADGRNVYVALRKTDTGKFVLSLHSDVSVFNDEKIFLPKKSPSGNIILEAYEPIHKEAFNSLHEQLQNKTDKKIRKNESNGVSFNDPNHFRSNNLKNPNLNTIKGHESECGENCIFIQDGIRKVKIKGVSCKKEPVFALKETTSGNFKIVLDKEYERYHKQAIKKYEGDNRVEYAHLQRSDSGHFIINFKENKNNDTKNALIVKTESGNIKVLVNKSTNDNLSNAQEKVISKSIMTANAFNELLNKSTSVSRETQSQSSRKSQLPFIKSNSDSNLFNKQSLNSQNKYNKDLLGVKLLESKVIATSCNAGNHDSSCDKSKCICKNLCYKSKQWFWENCDRETIRRQCDGSTLKQLKKSCKSFNTSEFKWYKRNDDIQVLKKPSHAAIKPCGCCLTSEKMSNEHYYCSINDTCPYYINKYESMSSELLVSGHYNKEIIERHTVETYNENDTLKGKKKDQNNFHWDSLEYFPPQLPPFLKDFTYV